MYTYKTITNKLLEDLVNDIENIGEYCESDDDRVEEVRETRDEILFTLVHKITIKYLNRYTQD